MNIKKEKVSNKTIVILGILIFLQIFVSSPFIISEFKLEWGFFAVIPIILNVILKSRYKKKKTSLNWLAFFILYCLILALFSFLRFDISMALVGFLHYLRMVILFLPFIWIVGMISNYEKEKLLFIIRRTIIISSVILILMTLLGGFLASGKPLATQGLVKNSLGYTIVCFTLFFLKFENPDYTKKTIPKIIWFSVFLFIVYATKSGTAFLFMLIIAVVMICLNSKLKIPIRLILILCMFLVFLMVPYYINNLLSWLGSIKLFKIKDFLYAIVYGHNGSLDSSNQLRLEVQLQILKDFDYKMALGNYYYYYFADKGYTAHQQYLQLLYDTGVIGLTLFMSFVVKSIKKSSLKIPVVLIFMYSFIENFLVQFIGLIILACLVVDIQGKEVDSNESNINSTFD